MSLRGRWSSSPERLLRRAYRDHRPKQSYGDVLRLLRRIEQERGSQ